MQLDPFQRPSNKDAEPPQKSSAQSNAARSETLVPPSRPKREEGVAGAAEGQPTPPASNPTLSLAQRREAAYEDITRVHAAVKRSAEMSDTLTQGVQGYWRSSMFRSGAAIFLCGLGLHLLNVSGTVLSPNPTTTQLTVASLKIVTALVLLAVQVKYLFRVGDLFFFGWQNRSISNPERLLDAHRARHVDQDFPKALDAFFDVLKSSPYGFAGARAAYGAFEISLKENNWGKRTAILQRFFRQESESGEWALIPLPDRRLPNKIVLGMLEAMEKTRFDTDYFSPDFSSHEIISLKTIQCIGSVFFFEDDMRRRVASGLELVQSGLGDRLPKETSELSKLALRLRTGIAPS